MKSIRSKLMLTFLVVIASISAIFSVLGYRFVAGRMVAEAQENVRTDLNAAPELYLNKLNKVHDTVRFTAESYFLKDALPARDYIHTREKLARIRERESLDAHSMANAAGVVLRRVAARENSAGDQSDAPQMREVLRRPEPAAATMIVSAKELRRELPELAERARFVFMATPLARARPKTEETSGKMLKAAAPVFDYQNRLIVVVYGGILLNRNWELVDRVKHTVPQGVKYRGKDIGTATIFQDDLRTATHVQNEDGSRAVGSRVAEGVYKRLVREGKPWIGRTFVGNHWYMNAHQPIRDLSGRIIEILYCCMLEEKHRDIRQRSVLLFFGLTVASALSAMALAYFILRRICVPIQKLVSASREVAHGNLATTVAVRSEDELRELADSFNSVATALKTRDQRLKEFTTRKFMESERLAIVGQLSAKVAHELNIPLQGIVSYSHLPLKKAPPNNPLRESAEKLVAQASRCKDVVRGLLDFARPRKPQKRITSPNRVLDESFARVEDQPQFHNICIVRNLQADLPPTPMDPTEIQQVLTNLLINAAEAMDNEDTLTDASQLDLDDNSIEIRVSDSSHSIPEEDLKRIFDPFSTTKDFGHGSGLALAIRNGIVKGHNGSISVESQVGRGTTLTVCLPGLAAEPAVEPALAGRGA